MESESATLNTSDTTASATPDSAPADSSVQATPAVSASPAENGSAQADSQTEAGSGSLTPDTETKQPSEKFLDPATYEKRIRDMQSGYTKERQRALDLERKYQALEQRLQEQERQREQANKPPWDFDHPERESFDRKYEKFQEFREWFANSSEAERPVVEARFNKVFTKEDQESFRKYEAHLAQESRAIARDPRRYFLEFGQKHFIPMIDGRLGQATQSYQQSVQAREAIRPWFEDKSNEPILKQHGEWMMAELAKPGATWDYVRAQAEALFYRSQVSGANLAAASADEKERLLRSNASGVVATSPKAQTNSDPNKIAESRGIKFGTPQYWTFLHEFHQNQPNKKK